MQPLGASNAKQSIPGGIALGPAMGCDGLSDKG
jgi:hypothetical protein